MRLPRLDYHMPRTSMLQTTAVIMHLRLQHERDAAREARSRDSYF